MEYVYAAMLIHKAGGKIDEEHVTKVLTAAGVKVDSVRVKALVGALDGVDINAAVEKAAMVAAPAAAPAAADHSEKKAAKKEEKKEEDDGAAAAGLGALFG